MSATFHTPAPRQADGITPRTLNVAGAVAYSGFSRARLYRLIAAGELASFSVGGRRMFNRTDLDAYIDRVSGAQLQGAA